MADRALNYLGVMTPGGTVMHWLRTTSLRAEWRDGEMGRTVCGRTRPLTVDRTGLQTCRSCERELDRLTDRNRR